MSELPFFDIVNGVVFDSMHTIDLGVMRQLFNLWFTSENCKSALYVGTSIGNIDIKISRIKPPSNITRILRSTRLRAY